MTTQEQELPLNLSMHEADLLKDLVMLECARLHSEIAKTDGIASNMFISSQRRENATTMAQSMRNKAKEFAALGVKLQQVKFD